MISQCMSLADHTNSEFMPAELIPFPSLWPVSAIFFLSSVLSWNVLATNIFVACTHDTMGLWTKDIKIGKCLMQDLGLVFYSLLLKRSTKPKENGKWMLVP